MSDQKELWAIVELLGHVRLAGRLTEEEHFGAKMGRLDVPDASDLGFQTMFFGGASVYRISPVSEQVARDAAKSISAAPVQSWDYPSEMKEAMRLTKAAASSVGTSQRADDGEEPDDGDFDETPAF